MIRPFNKYTKIKLDKELQAIFKPFYIINTLFCLRTYNIGKGFAYPLTKKNLSLSIAFNIVIVVSFYSSLKIIQSKETVVEVIYFFIYSQYVLTFTATSFVKLYQKDVTFTLLVKLQGIAQSIQSGNVLEKLRKIAITPCALVFIFYALLLSIKLNVDSTWIWARGFFISTTIIFETEIIHASIIILFLAYKLRCWRQIMVKLKMESAEYLTTLDELNTSFKTVMAAYKLTQRVFQIAILFHCIMTFVQSLIYFEVLILWYQNSENIPEDSLSHNFGVYGWIIKGICVETLLCYCCEQFYQEIEYVRVAIVLKIYDGYRCDHPNRRCIFLQRFGKSVWRTIDNYFSMVTACGVFTVDAALPLRLLGLLTTYTLVLLQFA